MKTCFSEEKLIKQLGDPSPLFQENPSFCLNFKNKKPPLILRGGNYRSIAKKVCIYIASNYLFKVNNRNIGEKGLKSSRLTIKTLEQHQ